MFRWRMRSLPQLLLVLSLLVVVVHPEEQPNPAADDVLKSGTTDTAEEEVQNRLTTGLRLEHELVKEQADAPSTVNGSSEGGIVAIHVDAVGGKEQLRPTLRGLSYLATKFLPVEYKFVEILSATREVVAGVRYELIVDAQEEGNGQKHVCRLVILEKPWITTEYGEKYRTLEYSNCTTNGEGALPSVEVATQLNPAYDANVRANQELTPQKVAELEHQIIIEKVEVLQITTAPTFSSTSEDTTAPGASTTESEGLSDAAKAAIDDLFSIVAVPSQQQQRAPAVQQQNREEVTEETIVPIRVFPEYAEQGVTTTTIAPLDQQVQSTFDEVFKTHQEIQKALDEVIANGGGREAQIKYRPVFDSLLQKVKASIDNYYRTTNGGDANVDTAAFVVRDNTGFLRRSTTVRPRPATRTSDEQSSAESDESQQQQKQNPQERQAASLEVILRPPKVDARTANYAVDSDEEDNGQQQVLTKEQLIQELNEDDGLQRVKKRSTYSSPEQYSQRYQQKVRTQRDVVVAEKQNTNDPNTPTEVAGDDGKKSVEPPTRVTNVESSATSSVKPVENVLPEAGNGVSQASATSPTISTTTPVAESDSVSLISEETIDSEEDGDKKLSKEELAKQLNADEGQRRNKRDFSGGFFDGGYSGGFRDGSYSGGGYYGGGLYDGYYGGGYYNPYGGGNYYGYYRPPYYGYYRHRHGHRGKRSAQPIDDVPADVETESKAEPTMISSTLPTPEGGVASSSTKPDAPDAPQAPIIEGVAMTFGDPADSDEYGPDPILTKAQLTEQLNADDGLRRNKRGYYSSSGSSSSASHYGGRYGGYYQGPPGYYNYPPPYYYGHYRGKRSSTDGGIENSASIDLNDPAQEASIKAIAQDAIVRLDQMDSDVYRRVLLEVLSAKRVSGRVDKMRSTYVLTVQTANSHCAEEESKDTEACRGLLMADTTKQCTLEVHVVKSKEDNTQQVQLTKSKCQKQSPKYVGTIVGGATPVDLTDPEHAERIRAGLIGYENGAHSDFEILQGTVQLVAGTIHRYKIALKDDKGQEDGTCDVRVFTPLPSVASQEPEYTFDCQQEDHDDHDRRRRSDESTPGKKLNKVRKTGGVQELTPEEYGKEEHQARIRTGLQKFLALTNADGAERKVKIVGASQQLVAGKSYTYLLTFPDDEEKRICKLNVWEKPWLKEKAPEEAFKATFDCGDAVGVQRTKRSFCAGCPSTIAPDEYGNSEHQERINKILSFHGVARESSLKVINATSQVVSGLKYTYYIEHGSGVCKLTAWERIWLAKSDPTEAYKYSYKCDKAAQSRRRRRRSVPGGIRALTKDELTDTEHVQRVDRILVSNGGAKGGVSTRIVSGTVQIVSGKLYKYAVEFDLAEDGSSSSSSKLCKLSSWERPWLEESNPTDAFKYTVSCPDEQPSAAAQRKRRHAKKVGSSNELTAEELKDKSHAERIKAGMVSYNAERSKAYNEFEIIAGSTQQVAGSLYKYTFRVTSEPDIVCKISIWERVWLESQDQRKYNVKCTGDDDTEQQQPDAKALQQETGAPSTVATVQRRSVRSLKIDDHEHVRTQFEKFKVRYGRQYASSLEHEMRFNIFRNNLFKIDQLNKFERGTAKYGVTKFADMTTAEYRMHTGLVVPKHHAHNDHSNHIRNPVARDEDVTGMNDLPESFDWRDHGAVTEVKDQGSCGSCWAFSAIGNIEGQHQIKTGKLESYSEQELIDCDKVDNGCGGGYMDDAFKAIEKLGGVELESDYPYRAKALKSCQFNRTMSHAQVKGVVDMPKNETFIAQYLVKNGPIAIALNANAMQFYRGGISHPWHPLCSRKSLDHGVLIVGYGVKQYPMFNKTLPYWIIKNSWGPKWGEQGYYRIYRGDNSCGVSEMASSAILA